MIKGILESVDKGKDHRARFLEIAIYTPELRNRKRLDAYLKLLVEELGWLEKKEQVQKTRRNPLNQNYRYRQWIVSWYSLTDLGSTFLELFPAPRVEGHRVEEEEERLPSPEEQEKNWKEWLGLKREEVKDAG